MANYFGITDLTADEITAIQGAPAGSMNYVVGPMISNRSVIGWTTNGHVGEDLFFYYYGLYHPMTILENTDIAYLGAHHLNLNLRSMDHYLFQPADLVFPALGATISIDSSDPANKVLVVTKGAKTARLPFSKDVIQIGGNEYAMNGITVYADKALNSQGSQGRVFVPHQALEFFQRY
jgi:alkaline phosphatase